jgi:hypothetical protein
MLLSPFAHDRYLLRRQAPALTGKFRMYGPGEQQLLYCEQEIFRFKEEFRAYRDESRQEELLLIQARHPRGFSSGYDVVDSPRGARVGVLRRRSWRLFLRERWELLDAQEQPLGLLLEKGLAQASVRRTLPGKLLPKDYQVSVDGMPVLDLRQRSNLLRIELELDFRIDAARYFDRRLGIAAALLLGAIERRPD